MAKYFAPLCISECIEETCIRRSYTIDCLRSVQAVEEEDVFTVLVEDRSFQMLVSEIDEEQKAPVITCLMLNNLQGTLDAEPFVEAMREIGFEPTYVRSITRKGVDCHAKFIDFESVEQMNAFIDFVNEGGFVSGLRVGKSHIKLSHKPVTDVPLKDPKNKKGIKNVWFNPKFYSTA